MAQPKMAKTIQILTACQEVNWALLFHLSLIRRGVCTNGCEFCIKVKTKMKQIHLKSKLLAGVNINQWLITIMTVFSCPQTAQ